MGHLKQEDFRKQWEFGHVWNYGVMLQALAVWCLQALGVNPLGKEKGASRADGDCLCLPLNEVLRVPRVTVNFSDLSESP